MEAHGLLEMLEFDPQRPVSKIVHSSGPLRLVLFCLEAGQSIPPHSSPSTVAFYTLLGRGEVLVGGRRAPLEPGSLAIAPPPDPHGLVAGERLAVLAAIAPSP